MIGFLSDAHHERLWRICDSLVSGAGARAAILCDATNGAVLVSVGDTSAAGAVSGVEALGPGERLVRGEGGEIYGVDVPGGGLLAVLHHAGGLEQIRLSVAQAVQSAAELIAMLPPPRPEVPLHAPAQVNETVPAPVNERARPKSAAAAKRRPPAKRPATTPSAKKKEKKRPAPTRPAPHKPSARKPSVRKAAPASQQRPRAQPVKPKPRLRPRRQR